MECWMHNLLISLVVLLHCRLAVALADFLVQRRVTSHLVSRKLVHLAATCTLLYWPLFSESDGWSWRLNTLTGSIYCIQLLMQGLIFPNPDDPEVRAMSRTGDPKELLYGPLVFGAVLCYVGHFAFRQELATFLMAALGFGDGLAPLTARGVVSCNNHQSWSIRYRSLGGEIKSVAGSFGMFLGTILGYFVFSAVLGAPESLEVSRLVGAAATATLAEAVSGMYDNLAIALAVHLYVNASNLTSR